MHHDAIDDHDHHRGLSHDLWMMSQQMKRRQALRWFAGAGTAALLTGCSGGSTGSTDTATVTTTTVTPTSTPTPTPTPTPTAAASRSCIADPSETAGPYPADGTNTASGSTSNTLTINGIVRSDIRASFISTTTIATGVQVVLTLTLVNVNAACAPLAGYAIYLWHCDRSGNYSLYTAANESYLRGVQVTNASGQVTFTTIFPGCYSGRFPHMHFEVFSSLANATGGRYSVLTSQLAMPTAVCNTIFADTATYPASKSNFAQVTVSNDNVFGDNTAAQITQQTPTFTAAATGYTATAVIGIAL